MANGCFLDEIMKWELSGVFHVQVHSFSSAYAERGEVNLGIRINTESVIKKDN